MSCRKSTVYFNKTSLGFTAKATNVGNVFTSLKQSRSHKIQWNHTYQVICTGYNAWCINLEIVELAGTTVKTRVLTQCRLIENLT
jgi:hypothetical protein